MPRGNVHGLPAEKVCGHCERTFAKDPRNTWAYWAKAKFCSHACFGEAHRRRSAENRMPFADWFAQWIDKTGDCWLWTGPKDKSGYGIFKYAGRNYRASIMALALDGRKPARGEYACHHCDNPPCVNPAHLYPGTPTQNMADAIARDRVRRGEQQHSSKLTVEGVRAIRASDRPAPELAAIYGVTPSNITMVRNGKTWRHVQ